MVRKLLQILFLLLSDDLLNEINLISMLNQ